MPRERITVLGERLAHRKHGSWTARIRISARRWMVVNLWFREDVKKWQATIWPTRSRCGWVMSLGRGDFETAALAARDLDMFLRDIGLRVFRRKER